MYEDLSGTYTEFQKCFRRRQHRLEREHKEIENQLRSLMLQPDAHKTDSDKAKEEELLNR